MIYSDSLLRQRRDNTTARKKLEKISKKLLTNESGYDKISELPLRTTATNEQALAKQEVMIFDK